MICVRADVVDVVSVSRLHVGRILARENGSSTFVHTLVCLTQENFVLIHDINILFQILLSG